MPITHNSHSQAVGGAELRGWEYRKFADVTAMNLVTGRPGEICTTTDTGDNWCWNQVSGRWVNVDQSGAFVCQLLAGDNSARVQAWVDDMAAFSVARNTGVDGILRGSGSISTTINLPDTAYDAGYRIDATGARITYSGSSNLFETAAPTDQSDANTKAAYRSRWLWRGGSLVGNAASGSAFHLRAVVRFHIEDVAFSAFGEAIWGEFCLALSADRLEITNNYNHGIWLGAGSWTGATGSNSPSNASVIKDSRFYGRAGHVAQVYVQHSAGVAVRDCIFEGVGGADNIVYDSGNNSAKQFVVDNVWFENSPTNANVRLAANGGGAKIGAAYYGGSGILVDASGSSNSFVVDLETVPFVGSAAAIFRAAGTGQFWRFGRVNYGTFNPRNSAWWSGAVVPRLVYLGFNGDAGTEFQLMMGSAPRNLTGARNLTTGGALSNLLTQLAFIGLITDSSTAGTIAFGNTGSRPAGVATGYIYYDTTLGQPIWWNGAAWRNENNQTPAALSGTTALRPAGLTNTNDVGYRYFDTTLGAPVWWNGTAWVTAAAGATPVNVTVTGDGATTVFTVTHNLALTTPFLPSGITVLDPGGNILSGSSYQLSNALTNSFTVTFAVAPANAAVHTFRVTA